jgi:hypothetical protein
MAGLKFLKRSEYSSSTDKERREATKGQPVELGTIRYVNWDRKTGNHGSFEEVLRQVEETGKPIFANFVEVPGSSGTYDAGKHIFSDPDIAAAAEECFVPAVFNTVDRRRIEYSLPHKLWGGTLMDSDLGYLRIIAAKGRSVVAATERITGREDLNKVRETMIKGLEELGLPVPKALRKEKIVPRRDSRIDVL